jgi:predicted alpha/beta-hydrolase family hydrolase
VPFNNKTIICERRDSSGNNPVLIFTHGAGGGLASPAARDFASGFAQAGISITSFQGTMNLQSRVKAFQAVIEHEDCGCILGGRSMGARAAAISAMQGDRKTTSLVFVSFPLIGGKKNDSREQILLDLDQGKDVLFIIGSNDGMCDLAHLKQVMGKMAATSWLCEVRGADHGMNWKWKDSVAAMRRKTGAIAADWAAERNRDQWYSLLSLDEEAGEMHFSGWKEGEDGESGASEGSSLSKKRKR